MNKQLIYFLQRVASSAASAAVYILAEKMSDGLQPKSRYPKKRSSYQTTYKQPTAKKTYPPAKGDPPARKQPTVTTLSKSEQARAKLNTRR